MTAAFVAHMTADVDVHRSLALDQAALDGQIYEYIRHIYSYLHIHICTLQLVRATGQLLRLKISYCDPYDSIYTR